MAQNADSSSSPRDMRDPADEPLQEDEGSSTPPAHTKQTELERDEKRKHDKSENDLPSSHEKNPVPPGTTRR